MELDGARGGGGQGEEGECWGRDKEAAIEYLLKKHLRWAGNIH